jgi:hypothetical protein
VTNVTQEDRQLLAELFDIPPTMARELLDGEPDAKPTIARNLASLARHREQARAEAIEQAAIAARNALLDYEWPPQDGDAQIDAVLDAIHALSPAQADDGWLPIEQAPKGKAVLVFVPRADWPENLPEGTHTIAYQTAFGEGLKDSWRYAFGPGHGRQCGWPTHYRLLPAPPRSLSAAQEG